MQTKKSREDLMSALAGNIPAEIIEANKPPQLPIAVEATNKPTPNALIKDTEEDYKFTRDNVKKLITTSDEAIGSMMNLATDSENPRAFEVLANLIKTASDVNKQLMDLQKDRKKLMASESSKKGEAPSIGNTTTNNSIFVGTTSDLQKFLTDRKAAEAIIDA